MRDSIKWATRRHSVELQRELNRTLRETQTQAWVAYWAKSESVDFPFGWMACESEEDSFASDGERRDGA